MFTKKGGVANRYTRKYNILVIVISRKILDLINEIVILEYKLIYILV